jgi:hypothetical protein
MALTEYWVDPVLGNNANPGTQAQPFAELRYATSTVITTSQGVNDTVIVNIAPSKLLDSAEQYIRLDAADWSGGKLIVRSAIPGLPWLVGATGARLIWAVSTCDAVVEIEDCQATMPRILEWAGLSTLSETTGVRLKIGARCVFRNSGNTAVDCLSFSSNARQSGLEITPGTRINRWASLAFGSFLRTVLIDGLLFNSEDGLARTTTIYADSLTVRNSDFRWPTSLNHLCNFKSRLTSLTIENNSFDMLSTNSASPIWIDAPDPTINGVQCHIVGNSFLLTSLGPVVVGNIINPANTRAVNDATRDVFASCLIEDNNVIQRNTAGGGLRIMIGTDNALVVNNYVRGSNLTDASDVHICYLFGAGIEFRQNFVQGSVLAFGPNQRLFGNIVVAKQNGVLLGGTQGGSNAIGGGNNYIVSGNILASVNDAPFNDYAFQGAYPTNLGVLVAKVNNNVYVPLAGSLGAVRLTAAGTYLSDINAIRNVWNSWGDAGNAGNDSFSRVASGSELSWYEQLRACNKGVFTRQDFASIREQSGQRQSDSAFSRLQAHVTNMSQA